MRRIAMPRNAREINASSVPEKVNVHDERIREDAMESSIVPTIPTKTTAIDVKVIRRWFPAIRNVSSQAKRSSRTMCFYQFFRRSPGQISLRWHCSMFWSSRRIELRRLCQYRPRSTKNLAQRSIVYGTTLQSIPDLSIRSGFVIIRLLFESERSCGTSQADLLSSAGRVLWNLRRIDLPSTSGHHSILLWLLSTSLCQRAVLLLWFVDAVRLVVDLHGSGCFCLSMVMAKANGSRRRQISSSRRDDPRKQSELEKSRILRPELLASLWSSPGDVSRPITLVLCLLYSWLVSSGWQRIWNHANA